MGPFWARAHGAFGPGPMGRAHGPGHGPRLGPWARAHGPGPLNDDFGNVLHFLNFYEKDAARLYELFAPNGAPRSLI